MPRGIGQFWRTVSTERPRELNGGQSPSRSRSGFLIRGVQSCSSPESLSQASTLQSRESDRRQKSNARRNRYMWQIVMPSTHCLRRLAIVAAARGVLFMPDMPVTISPPETVSGGEADQQERAWRPERPPARFRLGDLRDRHSGFRGDKCTAVRRLRPERPQPCGCRQAGIIVHRVRVPLASNTRPAAPAIVQVSRAPCGAGPGGVGNNNVLSSEETSP